MSVVGEYPWEIKALCASTLGREPSDDQLKYWRENKVICSLGEVTHPGGKGRISLYATGTARLVVRLLQLLQDKRDLGVATWTLWIEGHEIDASWSRLRLADAAGYWDETLADVRTRGFDGPNQESFSDEFLDAHNPSARIYNPKLRLIRKLVGANRLQTFMFHMVRLAMGHKLPEAPTPMADGRVAELEEHAVVVSGLGLGRMLVDKAPGLPAASINEIITPLNKVSEAVAKATLLTRINSSTGAELLAAAREVHAVQASNRLFYGALSWVLGKHAFGRGHAARMFAEYSNKDDVLLTALWVAARPSFEQELEDLPVDGAKMTEALHRQSQQAQLAARENPSLRETILRAMRKGQ